MKHKATKAFTKAVSQIGRRSAVGKKKALSVVAQSKKKGKSPFEK